MTIFHSYLDKTTVMEKTTILNYKMKGASVAEWLESLTSNHLSLISLVTFFINDQISFILGQKKTVMEKTTILN